MAPRHLQQLDADELTVVEGLTPQAAAQVTGAARM